MNHERFLLQALELAEQRRGFCSPNPSVGALVVKNEEVISTGYHYAAGSPHAEVKACESLANGLSDTILYVTLEPCCHWGRTPPCTELIVRKGINKVIYGYQDPNPQVAGKSENYLRQNGVECYRIDLLQVNDFYKSYTYWTINQKPWVTAKLAMSMDGKIAYTDGKPSQITGDQAQQLTHAWRQRSDAILTSGITIRNDNPSLNVRLNDTITLKPLYILDSNLSLPFDANIFLTTAKLTVFHASDNAYRIESLEKRGVHCRKISKTKEGLNLDEILLSIGADGIHNLWVEAGGTLFNSFINNGLAHKSFIYIAPKLLGSNAYPAFVKNSALLEKAKKIGWHIEGADAVCAIDWF